MIHDPLYLRLTQGWFHDPDPSLWAVIADWCQDHDEMAAASLWLHRRRHYLSVLSAMSDAWNLAEGEIVTVAVGPWDVSLRASPKRLAYSVIDRITKYRPRRWGKAPWHYLSIGIDVALSLKLRAIRMTDYLHDSSLAAVMLAGLA